MNVKKGSKNAIENREAATVMICPTCNGERKTMLVIKGGKKQLFYECKCGMTTRAGQPMNV